MSNNLTPMMEQYMKIKSQYPNEILFYRLGDFYEMFFDDALKASKALGLTLTRRSNKTQDIPMCGVPYHVSESYISKLIEQGYKVAVCDQMEDPKLAKNLVKREVTHIVTPGTFTDCNFLDSNENNYLMAVFLNNFQLDIAYTDYMTGELFSTTKNFFNSNDVLPFLFDEIDRINPSEILIIKNNIDFLNYSKSRNLFVSELDDTYLNFSNYRIEDISDELKLQLKNNSRNSSLLILINYLGITQKSSLKHLKDIINYKRDEFMVIDEQTKRNLELIKGLASGTKKGSLFQILDKTNTSMGARELKRWIENPLINKTEIDNRLDLVEELTSDLLLSDLVSNNLSEVNDIERLSFKISNAQISPKEIRALSTSLKKINDIKANIMSSDLCILKTFISNLNSLSELIQDIDRILIDNPPQIMDDKRFIRVGYDKELDELFNASENGQQLILELEQKEKERTEIKNLKIKYNKILGYFIDVTKSFVDKVPGDYIRKQTLVGSERYFTVELKNLENKISGSKEKAMAQQLEILNNLRKNIYKNLKVIQNNAKIISQLDVFNSLAKVSINNNYTKPIITDGYNLNISDGRHPIVESLNKELLFVPNDTSLNEKQFFDLITGPNMAGKSTYMRQVAIIVIMAHMGCYIPASSGTIPIVDRVFTRIGASDNLAGGDSTFMVEMKEVATILKNSNQKSLIILDEVGRGTSTYDGLSIAWAISEYIAKNIKSKTLFATHYHELTELENIYSSIKNLTIAVDNVGEDVIFLRKIISGFSSKSYGIEVAKLAGINDQIIDRAKDILKIHENNENIQLEIGEIQPIYENKNHKNFIDSLGKIDVNKLSPIDALNLLAKIIEEASDLSDN